MRHAITFLATGAYVGYLPVAPGTFGSLLAIPLLCALARLRLTPAVLLAGLGAFSVLAMIVCHRAGVAYADADSGKIVLDEVCGMLVAGAWIVPTTASLVLVFVLFRLFDIVKPFPARYLDRHVRNGIGVVADDLVAGLYANLVVRALT
ncbi:MAG: phosphatidylglycerophosphatase A [Deltaproteobacteria bacterium]|nr:phosphatidylglycerophosphatase A [Deltaproteobacteria bacterium]